MLLDMFGALPVDRIIAMVRFANGSADDVSGGSGAWRWLRMLKLCRALRLLVPRKARTQRIIHSQRSPSVDTLIKLGLTLTLLWHWTACLYYDVSLTTERELLNAVIGTNITLAQRPSTSQDVQAAISRAIATSCLPRTTVASSHRTARADDCHALPLLLVVECWCDLSVALSECKHS